MLFACETTGLLAKLYNLLLQAAPGLELDGKFNFNLYKLCRKASWEL